MLMPWTASLIKHKEALYKKTTTKQGEVMITLRDFGPSM